MLAKHGSTSGAFFDTIPDDGGSCMKTNRGPGPSCVMTDADAISVINKRKCLINMNDKCFLFKRNKS